MEAFTKQNQNVNTSVTQYSLDDMTWHDIPWATVATPPLLYSNPQLTTLWTRAREMLTFSLSRLCSDTSTAGCCSSTHVYIAHLHCWGSAIIVLVECTVDWCYHAWSPLTLICLSYSQQLVHFIYNRWNMLIHKDNIILSHWPVMQIMIIM